MDLMNLTNSINQEEQCYPVRVLPTMRELLLYDMLFREDLGKNDIRKLKEDAVTLFQRIKIKLSELDH